MIGEKFRIGLSALLYPGLLVIFLLVLFTLASCIHQPFLSSQAISTDKNVTTYLLTGDISILEGFSIAEISHLQDVRNLLRLGIIIFIKLFIVTLGLWILLKKEERLAVLLSPFIATIISLPLLLTTNFAVLFEWFHKALFWQGNYTFPLSSLLIQTYPGSFFVAMTISVGISFILLATIKFLGYKYIVSRL